MKILSVLSDIGVLAGGILLAAGIGLGFGLAAGLTAGGAELTALSLLLARALEIRSEGGERHK